MRLNVPLRYLVMVMIILPLSFRLLIGGSRRNHDFWYDLVYYVKMLGMASPDYIMYNKT